LRKQPAVIYLITHCTVLQNVVHSDCTVIACTEICLCSTVVSHVDTVLLTAVVNLQKHPNISQRCFELRQFLSMTCKKKSTSAVIDSYQETRTMTALNSPKLAKPYLLP